MVGWKANLRLLRLGSLPDSWLNAGMTLEDLPDLIRASSANLNRQAEELHLQSHGQLLNLQNDMTDMRGDVQGLQAGVAVTRADVAEVRRSIDLAETVAAMKRQIERLEADVAGLKRRA